MVVVTLAGVMLSSNSPDPEGEPTGVATLGAASAPVVLIYYTDYECAACREFVRVTLPALRQRYVDAGTLRIVVRDLDRATDTAGIANAARCAGEFGKYWAFQDAFVAALDSFVPRTLERMAQRAGVPLDPFTRCVASDRYAPELREGRARARALGIVDPPAFVVIRRTQRIDRADVVTGDLQMAAFDTLINRTRGR